MNSTSPSSQPHAYSGTLLVCLTCYRPKSDNIHAAACKDLESHISPSALELTPPKIPSHKHTCPVCMKESQHLTSNGLPDPDVNLSCNAPEHILCISCSKLPEEDKSYASWAVEVIPDKPTVLCVGHSCPGCGIMWKHDYACKSKSKGMCEQCATQSTANIFRPVAIEQIAQTSSEVLSGRERVETMIEHEAFVYSLCHDMQTNKLLPDWQEKIHEHRRNIKQMIEKLRCKEISTSKKTVDFEMEDTMYLTPEERESYERAARRGKVKAGKKVNGVDAAASTKPAKTVDPQKAYQDLIKSCLADVRSRNPKLSEDEVVKRANKRAEIMHAEEDE